MDGLDDFLNNEPTAEVTETPVAQETPTEAVAEAPAETAEAKAERLRDEKGRFAPKGEEAAPPAATQEPDHVPVTALQEERRKRQERDQRIADLEARLAQIQQPPQPEPDVFDEGFSQHITQSAAQLAAQQANEASRLWASEFAAKRAYPDFDAKKAVFLEIAQQNPTIVQEALADFDPWDKAYQIAANYERMQSLGATNVAELEAKLREQIRAELAAEAKPAAPTPPIPESLADQQSARGSTAPLHVPTLDEILGRKP